jgi:hypothetical protein
VHVLLLLRFAFWVQVAPKEEQELFLPVTSYWCVCFKTSWSFGYKTGSLEMLQRFEVHLMPCIHGLLIPSNGRGAY